MLAAAAEGMAIATAGTGAGVGGVDTLRGIDLQRRSRPAPPKGGSVIANTSTGQASMQAPQ